VKLTSELSHFNLGGSSGDALFLSNLTKNIFRGYLDTYINVESRLLSNATLKILIQKIGIVAYAMSREVFLS
jgi:hypothetical protein